MRKVIIFVLSLAILSALLSLSAMASGEVTNYDADSEKTSQGEEFNTLENNELTSQSEKIKEYLKEKILPVAVGVLTSVFALLATLGKIKRAISDLALSREELKSETEKRDLSFKEKSEYILNKTDEIKGILKDVPDLENNITELREQILILKNECEAMVKILSYGFLQSKDIITSGAGKRIAQLIDEIQSLYKAVGDSAKDDKLSQNTAESVANSVLEEAL